HRQDPQGDLAAAEMPRRGGNRAVAPGYDDRIRLAGGCGLQGAIEPSGFDECGAHFMTGLAEDLLNHLGNFPCIEAALVSAGTEIEEEMVAGHGSASSLSAFVPD